MSRFIAQLLLKIAIPLVLGLLLAGTFPRAEAWMACGLFVIWRVFLLAGEWNRSRQSLPDWEQRTRQLVEFWKQRDTDDSPDAEPEIHVPNPMHLAIAQVERERAAWKPTRPRSDLMAEVLGLLGYVLVMPLVVTLYREEFFSFRRSYAQSDFFLFTGGMALYAAPHLPVLRRTGLMHPILWWFFPAFTFFTLLAVQLLVYHPYLNPFDPNRRKLAAEKVLKLARTDNIVAGNHADWVTDYADDLARIGRKDEAVALCETALRLQPDMQEAMRLLDQLRGPLPEPHFAIAPNAPYFAPGESPPRAKRTLMSKELENVPACTVILMPMGDVGEDLLDYVAAVITRETGIPSLVYDRTLPLPEYTRQRGLLGSKQWSIESLIKPVQKELSGPLPQAPLRFLILTSADMYNGSVNFMFNTSAEWGGIVATAQFEYAGGSRALLCHRIAKQSLSAIIKSFGLQPATDRRCVTSYPNCIDEVDAKGNRPMPATREIFETNLRNINEPWQRYRAARQ